MFCEKCGFQLPDDSKFCVNCGSAIFEDRGEKDNSSFSEEQRRMLSYEEDSVKYHTIGAKKGFFSVIQDRFFRFFQKNKTSISYIEEDPVNKGLLVLTILSFLLFFGAGFSAFFFHGGKEFFQEMVQLK